MRTTSVQRIAGVLRVLMIAALVCNVILFYLVPVAVMSGSGSLLGGALHYLGSFVHPGEDDILAAGAMASLLAWAWCWREAYDLSLTLFLLVSGVCTAVMLRQGLRVVDTIRRGVPFSMENADALRRSAACAFFIAAAALLRVIWGVIRYQSLRPLATYNALFVPLFAMAGLLCLVMSALFRQAAELKAENDLTI